MRTTIYLYVIFSFLLCSCSSTYYYATLSTTDPNFEKLTTEEGKAEGNFLYENDSLWITYCFKGENAPIQITVFNKLDIPLYVDWDRSALIVDNTAYSYNDGISKHFAKSESTSYEPSLGTTKTYTNTYSTSKSSQNISFIPPKTKINHQTLRLSATFDDINMKDVKIRKMINKKGEELVSIKSVVYDNENSPFHFSSIITVYANPDKYQFYMSNFYASKLIKTYVEPQNLPLNMGNRGDIFYQCKRPNNSGWKILGGTSIILGAAAVEVLISDKDISD